MWNVYWQVFDFVPQLFTMGPQKRSRIAEMNGFLSEEVKKIIATN